jgi:hypothetical protein
MIGIYPGKALEVNPVVLSTLTSLKALLCIF